MVVEQGIPLLIDDRWTVADHPRDIDKSLRNNSRAEVRAIHLFPVLCSVSV